MSFSLVLSIVPKYAVSNLMGYLKDKLATRLFARYERLRRRYWGRHFWSRGYCVSTIGLDEEQIRKYVKWQEQREKKLGATQNRLFGWSSRQRRSAPSRCLIPSHRLWRWLLTSA
jgi:hypothetical protein